MNTTLYVVYQPSSGMFLNCDNGFGGIWNVGLYLSEATLARDEAEAKLWCESANRSGYRDSGEGLVNWVTVPVNLSCTLPGEHTVR